MTHNPAPIRNDVDRRNERVVHDPRAEYARLRTIDATLPVYMIVCCARPRLGFAPAMQCTWCGKDLIGLEYCGEPPAESRELKAESCSEFDIPAIVERIKARRELADTSISTLASELGIRADRLARFESGRVEDEDLPELLRALVWAAEFNASAIDAYRKPAHTEAANA